MKRAGQVLLFAIIAAGMAFQFVGGMTAVTELAVVDTTQDWTDAESSSTSINISDGIKLDSSATTGNYQSVNYDIESENLTSIDIYGVIENSSDSNATATVQYKNDSGTVQTTETVELSDTSQTVQVDDSYAQVSVQYDLERSSTSVTSPEVDYYKVNQETDSTLGLTILKYAIPLFMLGIVAFVTS